MTGDVASLAAGLGAGLCVLGGGFGIGRLVSAAMDGTARQPGASDSIRTAMVIGAGFIEAGMLLGLIVNLMLAQLPRAS
jgi:F-type H+-transporting ATPase subunit c